MKVLDFEYISLGIDKNNLLRDDTVIQPCNLTLYKEFVFRKSVDFTQLTLPMAYVCVVVMCL